jgi:predicted dehydrogenase
VHAPLHSYLPIFPPFQKVELAMSKALQVDRRGFIQNLATVVGGTLVATSSVHAASANDKLNLAFIGIGGRGGSNLEDLIKDGDVNVAAICDVNESHVDRVSQRFPSARKYADFRRLLDNLSDIDAVVVSTTEHTHAFATLPALLMKKPVYCEKPLTHNIQESRRIMKAAAEANVATQMGTQIHGMPNYRRVVELVQTGAIGKVTEAHVWVSRAWGLQNKEDATANGDIVSVTERPQEKMDVPKGLDWDLWIGPAPMRPYHEVYFPGPKWYRWWDFGSGTMSDLGSHMNDLPFWALKLDAPKTIESFGSSPHPEIAPASMSAVYEYSARENMPACKVSWYQGTHKPAIWKEKGIPQWEYGILFVGDKGMLLSDYSRHILLPEDKFVDFQRPTPFIPDSPGQHREWLDAIRNGTPTGSPFSYAGLLTEANHLGNVAYRANQKIEWDHKSMKATNCPAADQFIGRTPRKGWHLG